MEWPQFSLNDMGLTFRWCDLYIYKINSLQVLHVRRDSSTASTPRRPFSGLPVQFQSTRWATTPHPHPTIPNSCTVTSFDEVLQQQRSAAVPRRGEGRASNGFFQGTSQPAKGQKAEAKLKGWPLPVFPGGPCPVIWEISERTNIFFVCYFLRRFPRAMYMTEGISGPVHD